MDLATSTAFHGRVREREAIEALVASRAPAYDALLVRGEPGIGKSTLLEHGIDRARTCGYRVLTATPQEPDKRLPFVTLADLFAGVDEDELRAVPPAERDAVEAVLFHGSAAGPDSSPQGEGERQRAGGWGSEGEGERQRAGGWGSEGEGERQRAGGWGSEGEGERQRAGGWGSHGVALCVRSVLWALAERSPLLIAIDDLQWIDAASARALSFVLRRLRGSAIRFVGTARSGSDWDAVAAWLVAPMQILPVGPLDEAAFRSVLGDQTDCDLTRDAHRHLHATAGGNPTIGIKIARECVRDGGPLHRPYRFPVPSEVERLIAWRLHGLPEDTRTLLLAAAAAVDPWLDRIAAVSDCDTSDLTPAVERGLIHLVGQRVRFRNQLLANAVYWQASPVQRRQLHQRFAQTTSDVVERAHHLAVSCTEPDEQVANVLETAAACLRSRGAPGAAAELTHAAARLTPSMDHEEHVRRLRTAADHHLAAGDHGHARELYERVAGDHDAGPARAHALAALARLRARTDDVRAAGTLATAAKRETTDLALQSVIEREAAWTRTLAGDLPSAARRAQAALDCATQSGDAAAMAGGLAIRAWVEALLGRPDTDDGASEQGGWQPLPAMRFPDLVEALIELYTGSLDRARVTLFRMQRELVLRGDDHTLAFVLIQLAELECLAGHHRKARVYADDARDLVEQTGQAVLRPWALHARALLEARHGSAVNARRLAEHGSDAADQVGAAWLAARNRGVVGLVELSVGDPQRAERVFRPLVASLTAEAPPTPLACPWMPDAIEALVLVGRLDDAQALLGPYEAASQSRQWPTGVLAAARCRALLAAAQGTPHKAAQHLNDAMTTHAAATPLFDQARAQLDLGVLLRRCAQHTEARMTLEDALRRFEALASPQWAAQAHDELATAEPHNGHMPVRLLATRR